MLTVLSLFLFLCSYTCTSLDIATQINNCDTTSCIISLDPSPAHTLAEDITNTTGITNTSINITSNSIEPATILVAQSLVLPNYASTITFENVIIDGGSFPDIDGSFIQIDTNKPMQINIINSQIINFNTTQSVININENIKSFSINTETDTTKQTISVVYTDISEKFITINFINSNFTNNTNHKTNGGILSLTGHEFQININQCKFTNNKATAWRKNGGCISWDRSAIPDPLVNDVNAEKQKIEEQGNEAIGPIFYDWTTSIITEMESFIHIINSKFYNNHAHDAGGVFYVIQTKTYDNGFYDISSLNSTTSPTQAPTASPTQAPTNTTEAPTIVVMGPTSSPTGIPTIYPTSAPTMFSTTLDIIRTFELYSEGNTYMGNTAGQYGGVFRHNGYMEKQEEYSEIDLICEDENYNITMRDDVYDYNGIPEKEGNAQSYAFGATLSSTCAQISVETSNFTDNYAKYGAAMSIYASSSVEINDCDFIGNNGTFGTVYINGLLNSDEPKTKYEAYISGSNFIGNRAENAGAGIFGIIIDKMYIDYCEFRNNWNKFYGSVSVDYFATYHQMNVNITDSIFTDNIVISNGIGVGGAAITAQYFDFDDGGYALNCYNDNGNGWYDDIEGLNLYVEGCIFRGNHKAAIGLNTVSAYITNCTFKGNYNEISHGGAIESKYSWFKVLYSTFNNNNAEETGGAISTGIETYRSTYPDWKLAEDIYKRECEIHIESSRFTNNYAKEGLGGAVFIGVNSVMKGNTFISNNAGYGGAVAINAYRMWVQANQFVNNSADIHGGCLFQTQYSNEFTIEDKNDIKNVNNFVAIIITQNIFSNCISRIGGGVFLRTSRNEKIEIHDNNFTNNLATEFGGGFVIGQLLPIQDINYGGEFEKINKSLPSSINNNNVFTDNLGREDFNDFISNPHIMYILSENATYSVSPGIATSARLGAYDIFDQDFVSFMITDWRDKEHNFEFFLDYNDSIFELLTVNSGSLSSGQANISFEIIKGREHQTVNTLLGNNEPDLINEYDKEWELVECPPGYGYNKHNATCDLCKRNTFKVKDGWTICNPCLDGLSCRGGEHVQILHKNWWSAEFSDNKKTFFCRLGECCGSQQGCAPDADERCPDDRDPDSIGCGKCTDGLSAMHGSHICDDCTHLHGIGMYAGAIAAFIIWPIVLVFLFGISKYDGDKGEEGNICKEFYSISIIEITIIVLIDYYQSLPPILTFEPDSGTYFLINLFFARIPITKHGLCLFDAMTILQKIYWDLLIPSIILILSFLIFIFSHYYNNKLKKNDSKNDNKFQRLNIFFLEINGWFVGWVYDPLRSIMFSLFFCIIPMLWSCSKLFKCIEYGEYTRFWNASGEKCEKDIVIGMCFLFIVLTAIYVMSNIYYSNSHLLHHDDIQNNKKLIPLYLQRVQPFYFMVYPFNDKNSRRRSKISKGQSLTWQNIEFRKKRHFKYLYVGWCSPFLRKITCLLIYNCITGEMGQSDQTFIVTNLILITLVTYQLFSQDYTSTDNYTLHLYCMYLLYWLVLLIVSGSTKIISENYNNMKSLRYIVNFIMWIPFITAIFAIIFAFALKFKPELLERAKEPKTKEERDYQKKLTLNKNFMSQRSIMSSQDDKKDTSDNEIIDQKEDDNL